MIGKILRILVGLMLAATPVSATVFIDEGWEGSCADITARWNNGSSYVGFPCTGGVGPDGAMDIVTSPVTDGSQSIRLNFAGSQYISPFWSGGYADRTFGGSATTDLWITWNVYLSPDFKSGGDTSDARLGNTVGTKSWYSFMRSPSTGLYRGWVFHYFYGGLQLSMSAQGIKDAKEGPYGTENMWPNVVAYEQPRGKWVCYEANYKLNTPGQANGHYRLYGTNLTDGGSAFLISQYTNREFIDSTVGGTSPSDLQWELARIYRQDGLGYMNYDRVKYSDTRVGCSGSTPPPPTVDTTPPPVPATPTVAAQTLPLSVSWPAVQNPGDLSGYKYYRKLEACSGSIGMTLIQTLGNTLAYSDSTVPNTTTNACLKVSSYDSSGNESSLSSGRDVSLTPPVASTRTTTVTDTFSVANVNPLPSPWLGGYTQGENFQLLSGNAAPAIASTDTVMIRNETTPNDQWACALYSAVDANSYPGVLLRFADPATKSGYEFRAIGTSSVRIGVWNTGVLTVLGSASLTLGNTDQLCAEAEGTALRLFVVSGGVSTLRVSASDGSYTTGKRGLITNNSTTNSSLVNEFTGGNFGTGADTSDTYSRVASVIGDPYGADIAFTGKAHKIRYWNVLHPRETPVEITGLGGVSTYRLNKTWETDPTSVDWFCVESQGSDGVWETTVISTSYICSEPGIRAPLVGNFLEVCPLNTRWVCDSTGRGVWLGGLSGGDVGAADSGICNIAFCFHVDLFRDDNSSLNVTTHLASNLTNYGMNLVRAWSYEQRAAGASGTDYLRKPLTQFPWTQTSSRTQTVNGFNVTTGIYDLNTFNQTYFDRWASRVDEALAAGVTPVIILFSSGHLEYDTEAGKTHPFYSGNNTNGVSCDTNANNRCEELRSLSNTVINTYQDAYVRKMIDTMATRNGIIWELDNEGQQDYTTFYNRIYQLIKSYEPTVRADGKSNIVLSSAYNFASRVDNSYLSGNTNNDAIGPSCTTDGTTYDTAPPANGGTKLVFHDSDHATLGCGTMTVPWVYRNLMRANNLIFLDEREDSGTRIAVKTALGYAISFSKRLALEKMTPVSNSSIFSTSYGLYNACNEYAMYMENDGSSSIDLSACGAGLSFTVEYMNLSTGVVTTDTAVAGSASRSFNPSGTAATLVRLKLVSGDTTAPVPPTGLGVR